MTVDTEESVHPDSIKLSSFNYRNLWRVTLWGTSAALAVAIVAGTAASDLGAERFKLALVSALVPSGAPAVSAQRTGELEKKTQELTDAVRELSADRDRLKGRLAILEQTLDDVTGTVKKQSSFKPADAAAAAKPPVISAPATIAAVTPPVAAPGTTEATTTAAIPAPAPVPLPPVRTSSIANQTGANTPAEAAPAAKREIGIDLGGGSTLEALRVQWAATKANLGPELVGLQPSYSHRQKASGAPDYRLIAGPFTNSAAAIRLCAKLAASRINCRPGVFTAELLADR